MPLIKIAAKSDLPAENEAREFTIGERVICIANVAGGYSAVDNVCLHRGGPLGQGTVEGGKIVCPWHGWQYHPTTGEAEHNPTIKVAVYPLKIEGEDVLVDLSN
jgi:nitrite reductase (NADH) small subunit